MPRSGDFVDFYLDNPPLAENEDLSSRSAVNGDLLGALEDGMSGMTTERESAVDMVDGLDVHVIEPDSEFAARLAAGRNERRERRPPGGLRSVSMSTCPAMAASHAPAETKIPDLAKYAQSMNNVADSTMSLAPPPGSEAKKPKKEVSDYYKKQNELLDNFEKDSQQIQVFQKTRTRQRLTSSTSNDVGVLPEESALSDSKPDDNDVNDVCDHRAPLLKHASDEDADVVPIAQSSAKNMDMMSDVLSAKDSEMRSTKNEGDKEGMGKRSASQKSVDSAVMRHEAAQSKTEAASKAASRLAAITLLVNISLMMAKTVASYLSGSISIISSLVDSIVDITSGLVIYLCGHMIKKRDPYLYPRGRTRLEPLSLIIISVVMGVASLQLIGNAISRIKDATERSEEENKETLHMELPTIGIMVATVVIKFTLFCICQKYKSDPSIEVLAQDHRNDCLSNTVALACAWLGRLYWYYLDPIGAIVVSFYILTTWARTGWEHLSKLSGKSAEPEFINRIIKVCIDHDPRISHIDTVYVYHFGSKFLVEVHIVLDENMLLKVAHDISESLQINIESLPEVERAFVHTDYDYEHHPNDEHKVV